MTDLHNRFRALDDLRTPDLWREIEGRALAVEPRPVRSLAWVLILVVLLLTVAVGGAALVGSGIIKLPLLVDASVSPSATPVQPVPASWTATGSMMIDRADHTATLLLDGTVLVVGSVYIAGPPGMGPPSAATELYDPGTGTWTATGSMIEGRLGHTATRLADGRVLVTGGDDDGVSPGLSAELYDPISGTWAATGNMIEPFGIATLLLDGRVLVAGSGDSGPSAQLYHPGSGTWTVTGSMIEARGWRTATLLLDGRVLVTDGGGSGSAELYDPDSGTWTVTGSMIEARSWHSATLLPDGTVLVVGGMGSTGSGGDEVVFLMASAELYDPDTGTWTATESMIEARHDHKATRLADGRVLVTGGGVASIEVYDPSSGSWTATVSMIEGRGNHTATPLSDGRVLVTGGYINTGSGGSTASAELYDPGSGN